MFQETSWDTHADQVSEAGRRRETRSRQLFQLPETFGWMEVAAVLDPRAVGLTWPAKCSSGG